MKYKACWCMVAAAVAIEAGGCSMPTVKPGAWNLTLLDETPIPASRVQPADGDEWTIAVDSQWLADIDPAARLTFAGYRDDDGRSRFAVVVDCDPATDRLILAPLPAGQSPLDALADKQRSAALLETVRSPNNGDATIKLSLRQAIADARLGPPLPASGRVFAVAANYTSHIREDLALTLTEAQRDEFRKVRARVFLKYPPTPPPNNPQATPPAAGFIGPFDEVVFPPTVTLPPTNDGDPVITTKAVLDHEVEIGAVIGRRLTSADAAKMSDEQLQQAIAGYVLVTDTKLRNAQVVNRVNQWSRPAPPADDPYHVSGIPGLGHWNTRSCLWWSHAAGWGRFTAVGPFFIAATGDGQMSPRGMITARTYAPETERGGPRPPGLEADTFYLRQCSRTDFAPAAADPMVWSIPLLMRSILAADGNALDFITNPGTLEPGDIICLGTPGGVVITSKPPGTLKLIDTLFFWWNPRNWHDTMFNAANREKYLLPGDEVFYWARGLGYQHLRVRIQPEAGDASGSSPAAGDATE